jgi:hypothetical protein
MEAELEASKEWFEITLRSISDGNYCGEQQRCYHHEPGCRNTDRATEEALDKDFIDVLKFKDFEKKSDSELRY